MKTICIVSDGYWDQLQGGAELQLSILGEELTRLGYQVHYIYVDRGTPTKPTPLILHSIKVPTWLKKLCYPYQVLLGPSVRREISRVDPDVIINRVGNGLTGICAQYSLRHGVPFIWCVANIKNLLPWQPTLKRTVLMSYLDSRAMRYGISNATYIVAQAEYQNDLLLKHFGRRADLVVANCHPDEPRVPIRNRDERLVVWVANIKAKKQPEMFIRLARHFQDCRSIRFVMIGRPESRAYQRDIEADIVATPNLDYYGEMGIEAVNQVLCSASVFVNTSLYEGFPNTFVQAWLREVPVVSLAFDPDDVLARHGLGYHSGTFEQMCVDVERLIGDRSLRNGIGRRAREYALSRHGIADNVSRMANLIETSRVRTRA